MRAKTLLLAAIAATLPLAACGDDDVPVTAADSTTPTTAAPATGGPDETSPGEVAPDATFPVTVEPANGELTLEARPARIVSLSATATEMLFAIGAGDQVIAVDDQSDFPEDVPTTDLSGFEPNLEAIAGYEPDLVVAASDPAGLVDGLEGLDIPTAVLPAATTLEETYDQTELLGRATGHEAEAEALVEDLRTEIDELVASVPESEEPLTYYHELDDQLFTATSGTFIGEVYSLAGLENVADAADSEGTGFPQLSAEYLIAEDPDLIFLADTECCGQSAETVAERPGFADLTAVREGRVVELSDDVASRWGPRIVDLLRAVVEATERVPA